MENQSWKDKLQEVRNYQQEPKVEKTSRLLKRIKI